MHISNVIYVENLIGFIPIKCHRTLHNGINFRRKRILFYIYLIP